MKGVTIRVPATSGNVGPGFDALGLALKLYNHARLQRARGAEGVWSSAHQERLSPGAKEMIRDAGALFFKRSRQRPFPFDLSLRGDVPVARGLGSSVTVRLGVVAGLNELSGVNLSREFLLGLLNELEHHPDNAAPALFGGFTAAGCVGRTVRFLHVPVARTLRFVTLIPRFEISTERARELVPQTFSKEDTVHNISRVALITAGFASGRYEALRGLFDDRVHQPYRERLIPRLSRVIRAGEKAGAIGGWLSGSGSTIICVTLKNAPGVARAMRRQLPDSDVLVLSAENEGLRLTGR